MANARQFLIISVDETRLSCTVLDECAQPIATESQALQLQHPHEGWAELDGMELIHSLRSSLTKLSQGNGVDFEKITAIGISAAARSIMVWDKFSAEPMSPMLLGSCQRSSQDAFVLSHNVAGEHVRSLSGLPIWPIYPLSKLKWLLGRQMGVKEALDAGDAVVGSLDTWILAHLTDKSAFCSDWTQASQTQLYNPTISSWDSFLLNEAGIEDKALPSVGQSAASYGVIKGFLPLPDGIPICALAALDSLRSFGLDELGLGRACLWFGDYTECVVGVGSQSKPAEKGFHSMPLLGQKQNAYGYRGFLPGLPSLFHWLVSLSGHNGFAEERLEDLAPGGQLLVVPGMPEPGDLSLYPGSGVGDTLSLFGLKGDMDRREVVRSLYKGMAYQVKAMLDAMEGVLGFRVKEMLVGGSELLSPHLYQFLADSLQVPVLRYTRDDADIVGAARLIQKAMSGFTGVDSFEEFNPVYRTYVPEQDPLSSFTEFEEWRRQRSQML